VPAQALLERYLREHPRSSRTGELEVLTAFYSGDYEAAAQRVEELRLDPRTPTDLGAFADIIVQTYETTKAYETFRYENFEVRYAPGDDEILVPYAIDTLKAATEALEAELGVKMVSPVRLEIYPDADSLSRVSTLSVEAIRTTGTIALSKWGRLMIASPRTLLRGYPWLDTIAHEYVHLLLTKATLNREVPRDTMARRSARPPRRSFVQAAPSRGSREPRVARFRSTPPVHCAVAKPTGRGSRVCAGVFVHRDVFPRLRR
jgi:hypothetical protein